MTQQSLVFRHQRLTAQLLLNEFPVVVDALVLLDQLLLLGLCLYFLVVVQELGELRHVKASRLLIDEGRLRQHRVRTGLQHILHLSIGNGQTQLFGFLLQNGGADHFLPNLILQLVEFLIGKALAPLGHLDDFLILVNHCLKVLYGHFLS